MNTREEVNLRNVMAVKAHSEETRKMVREFEKKLNSLDMLIEKTKLMETQIQSLQVRLFSGAATS